MSKVRVNKATHTEMVPKDVTTVTIELPLEVAAKLYKLINGDYVDSGYPVDLWSLRNYLGDALADSADNVTYPRSDK